MNTFECGDAVEAMKIGLLLVVVSLFVLGCTSNTTATALDIPTNGLMAAYTACPADQCVARSMGGKTVRLPFDAQSGVSDRWCVEILFMRNNLARQLVVEIKKTKPVDDPLSWSVGAPVYDSNCSVFK